MPERKAGADGLPYRSLCRLLAVIGIVVAPLLPALPLWEPLALALLLAWRLLASRQHWRPLPGGLRLLLTLAAGLGIQLSYGRFWGQQPGVALLVLLLALKLTELRRQRDVGVVVLLLYFLLLTLFLRSQALWTLAHLALSLWLVTAVLVDTQRAAGRQPPLPWNIAGRQAARLLLPALPLALLMFVLFPRLPGPLWSLPSDAASARSGLDDRMSPGELSRLALSDDPAFRVRFDATAPPPTERYWRGPVLTVFDGRSWSAPTARPRAAAFAAARGPGYDYEVLLDSGSTAWLYALDLVDASALPARARLEATYELRPDGDAGERRRYRARSYPDSRLDTPPGAAERASLLALPAGRNPRSLALAQSWRAGAATDTAVVARALQRFHDEAFYYTLEPPGLEPPGLEPPGLGTDAVDDFLFRTRRGYCEHYASAFTVLMRAAGVPARVVTGYYGGAKNPFGAHYVVRQSDAHAWSEVWIDGRGWQRVDPTSAIAPNRVEAQAARSAFPLAEGVPGGDLWRRAYERLRDGADWIDTQWAGWVLGYGTDLQQDLLGRLGLGDWGDMLLALTAAITLVLAAIGARLLRRTRAPVADDAAHRLWQRLRRRLEARGHRLPAGEGPRDLGTRIAAADPALAPELQAFVRAYLDHRYGTQADAGAVERRYRALERALRRPRRSR